MKERPILFSGEMVRAILDGRKTQTRRVINPQPQLYIDEIYPEHNIDFTGQTGRWWTSSKLHNGCDWAHKDIQCPYGQPGDRLWVRETWSLESNGGYSQGDSGAWLYELVYKADMEYRELKYAGSRENDPYCRIYDSQRGAWRPSIHMPRWASRINLEITDVRVERLQDISDDDVFAEGIEPFSNRFYNLHTDRDVFARLWDSINLKRGYGWDTNPWVWVIEFKRLP